MPIREGVGTYEVLDGILDRRLHANNNQEGIRNECGRTTDTHGGRLRLCKPCNATQMRASRLGRPRATEGVFAKQKPASFTCEVLPEERKD